MEASFPRALLSVASLLAQSMFLARERLGERGRQGRLLAELSAARETCQRLRNENHLLRERLGRLPGVRRPRYRSWDRFRILWHRARYGLSVRGTAKAFVLLPDTVRRWMADAERDRPRLSRPGRPVRDTEALITTIAHQLKHEQIHWGTRRIALLLARLGLQASRSTVQRVLRKRPPGKPAPTPARKPGQGSLRATRPNHVWLADFTKIRFLGILTLHIGAVIDLHSRKIVAILLWKRTPTAKDAAGLVGKAVRGHARPRHLVTDQGTQFTAKGFVRFLGRRKIRHRYGAVNSSLSVSVIERFWRTFKVERGEVLWAFLPERILCSRAETYVRWYNAHRPHGGLKGATPDEAFGDRARAVPKPSRDAVLERRHLDGDPDLPIYRLSKAA